MFFLAGGMSAFAPVTFVPRIGACGYEYIHGYPRKVHGCEYGYGWEISYLLLFDSSYRHQNYSNISFVLCAFCNIASVIIIKLTIDAAKHYYCHRDHAFVVSSTCNGSMLL